MEVDRIQLVRNLLRLVMSLALGALLFWVIQQARSEFATLGTVEDAKWVIMGSTLFLLLALWAPWRPLRIVSALLLLIGPVIAGMVAVLVLIGGPDSRGPQPPGTFAIMLLVVALLCVPMFGFLACEWQLASHERSLK
ncbi:MAG TPA: hypothetical protein VEK08_11895 [Planctomycetota bacterium]|nr:hypothetical protein [Planctomycetota bacterium]